MFENTEHDIKELWKEAKGLQAARMDLLAQIGQAYMEIERIESEGRGQRSIVETCKAKLSIIESSLKLTVEGIVGANGVEDGEWSLDFEHEQVVPKNGTIPNICDS
jgi:hypothetical protein